MGIHPDAKTGQIPYDKQTPIMSESVKGFDPNINPETAAKHGLDPWYNDPSRHHDITKEPEYEAAVRAQYEKLNYRLSYGWEHNNPGKDQYLYDYYYWMVVGVLCVVIPISTAYFPDGGFNKDETWYKREALIRIQERLEANQPLIDPNF